MKYKEVTEPEMTSNCIIERAFTTEEGYHGVCVFNRCLAHRCGYVGVTKDHALHGKDYLDNELDDVQTHGGLTFADTFPDIGEGDLWYFGFDCGHIEDAGDMVDGVHYAELFGYSLDELIVIPNYGGATVKTLDYVIKEVKLLSKQLAELDYNKSKLLT